MLQNPNWDRGTFSHFISFLASKPSGEGYPWNSCKDCAFGQYSHSIGDDYITRTLERLGITNADYHFIGAGWTKEESVLDRSRWTFGQALDRAIKVGTGRGLLLLPEAICV